MSTIKEPRPYQIEDLAFFIKQKKCAFLHDPGAGKTLPACLGMEYVWSRHQKKSYWIMPKSLLAKNKQELIECTNFSEHEIMIVDGTPKERAIQMGSKNAKVFLMGFKRFSDDWQTLRNLHPEMGAIFIDEFHMGFKSHNSKRTKELFKCARLCDFFLAMSGTLIDGRLDSCYPAIHIIEPRYYANHWSFKVQHAIIDEYGTVIAWTNHAKIGHIFKKHCVRRTFKEVYGSDEQPVIIPELCQMHPKQREAYKEFEDKAILELSDEFLEGFNPGVHAIRCRQIMAHPETFGLLKEGELTGKDESLLVHLQDHINKKEPVLIYASLQPEQERIYRLCQKEGFNVGLINGNVSAKERARIDEDFRAGRIDALVGSAATAAVGYNWSHIDHVIFASLDYQDVNFTQAYKRCIRGKRDKRLWVTLLEYEKSIDQRIFEIVNRKSEDLHAVDDTYDKLNIGSSSND